MTTTADRYREAGMRPPKGEVHLPDSGISRRRAMRVPPIPPTERVHDPATDGPTLPEVPASAYGPDSVPLDSPDADNNEEQS